MLNEKRVDVRGMFFCFAIMIMAAVLLFANGCATSETASVQSAPFSYSQGSENVEDEVPYIHLTVHVMFRQVPKKGATARFMNALGQTLDDLNVIGAITSMGTQPERMLSRLEDGTRAHLAIPIRVPLPEGRDTDINISTNNVKQAASEALKEVDLDDAVEGIRVEGVNVRIKSTIAGDD